MREAITQALTRYYTHHGASASMAKTKANLATGMEVKRSKPRPVPAELQQVNSIKAAIALTTSKIWKTGRDLKIALDQRINAAAKAAKIDLAAQNAETRRHLISTALSDARAALVSNANAVGWYDKTVTKALDIVATIHPDDG